MTTATEAQPQPPTDAAHDFATKEERESGHHHVVGEKCDACATMAQPIWQYAGGATSFGEVDRYMEAAAVQGAVDGEMSVFDAILSNIRMSEMDARAKAAAIVAAATELDSRLDRARRRAEDQMGERALTATTNDPGFMTAFKDTAGQWRWLAVHSNKYRDREGEIFPESAHKEWVNHVWETKEFPALRLWHVPINIGKADWVDYDDNGFVVSSGTFLPGWESAAEQLAQRKDLGCSHGYIYPRSQKQGNVYGRYKTFEISVLPRNRAANTLTAYFAGEEMPMLTPERKEFIAGIAGADRVNMMEESLGKLKSIADEAGLSYKSMEEAIMEQGTKDETAVATPPAAAAPATPAPAATESPAPAAPEAATAQEPVAPEPDEKDQADAAATLPVAAAAEAESEMVKGLKAAFAEVLAPLQQQLGTITTRMDAQDATIAGLKAADDAKIAAQIAPRVGPINGAQPASTSDANIVEPPAGAEGAKELPAGGDIVGSGLKAAAPHVDMLRHVMNGIGTPVA